MYNIWLVLTIEAPKNDDKSPLDDGRVGRGMTALSKAPRRIKSMAPCRVKRKISTRPAFINITRA
jgi:capsular polysaccharide biosynthesis protein